MLIETIELSSCMFVMSNKDISSEFIKEVERRLLARRTKSGLLTRKSHDEDHRYILKLRTERRIITDRRNYIKKNVMSWAIITFLGAIVTIILSKLGLD